MIRVFLVDDHEIVRRGIKDMLDNHPDLHIVGEAGTVADALAMIPDARADLAILDVRLPDGNGVELCRELRSHQPELNCLMLTSYADDDAMFDAIMAGAAGFVIKQVLGADLAEAARTVGSGGSMLDAHATASLIERLRHGKPDPLAGLSQQERTVFELVGEGLTNRQIGERMFLSDKTVKNYVSHVLTKLDMQRRAQIAVMATKLATPERPPTGT